MAGFDSKRADKDTVGYLDFQIQQWLKSIPPDLQLLHPRLGHEADNQSRSLQRLRVLLYIRGNQMRAFIHRHNVLSASDIAENLAGARLVTDIAKDTICVLVHLRESSTIYETQQVAFNYFLVSAISAIFLAVCHAPTEFSDTCRKEFYSALDLLKDFASHSYGSRRLWKSVRGLKDIAPRVGLSPSEPLLNVNKNSNQLHAAVAGYSSQPASTGGITATGAMPAAPETLPFMDSQNDCNVSMWLPSNGECASYMSAASTSVPDMCQVGYDLTYMFEALGNTDGQIPGAIYNMQDGQFPLQNSEEISRLFGGLL